MKDDIIVIVAVVETVSEKDEPASGIRSRTSTRAYTDGWDRVFGCKDAPAPSSKELN